MSYRAKRSIQEHLNKLKHYNMKINANASGTRTIEVTEEQLQIIRKYSLFDRIANSTGVIDEESLNKLRLTVRSLIASQTMASKELLDICPILYHEDMKALGLKNLIKCYTEWMATATAEEAEGADE